MTASLASGKGEGICQPTESVDFIKTAASARTSAEGIQRVFLSVVHLKHRNQLGDLHDVLHALRQPSQFDIGACSPRRGINAYQGAESAAIDVAYAGKVQHHLTTLTQYTLETFAQTG